MTSFQFTMSNGGGDGGGDGVYTSVAQGSGTTVALVGLKAQLALRDNALIALLQVA
jgi:hypothetical protein